MGECKNARRQGGRCEDTKTRRVSPGHFEWQKVGHIISFLFLFLLTNGDILPAFLFKQIQHDWGESWYDPSLMIFNMKGEPEGPVRISK